MRHVLVAALVLLAARSVSAAEPVASSGPPPPATSAAPSEAPAAPADPDADAVVDAAPAGEDAVLDSPAQRASYQKQHLEIVPGGGVRVKRDGRTLSGAELYLALDRSDLADDYRFNQRKRLVVGAVGAALIGVGVWLPFRAGEDCSGVILHEPCDRQNDAFFQANLGLGLGAIALGAGVVAAAVWWFDGDPVNPRQLDRLVEHTNWRLRRHLGVVDVAVTPRLGNDGSGGLVLSGSF
jgi:hypothetical protein